MVKSESIPTCKDCKYCVVRHYCWECSHQGSDNTYVDPVTGEHSYPSTCGEARYNYLKCGPNGSFFEYSRWAKLKIAIKEVFNSDK